MTAVAFFDALAAAVRAFVQHVHPVPSVQSPANRLEVSAPSTPKPEPERTPFALVSDGSGGSERAVRNAVMGGETLCAACLTETATGTVHMRLPLASRPVVVGVCHACGDGDIGREWHVLDHVQDGTLNIGGL